MDGTPISAATSQTDKSNADDDTEDVDVSDLVKAHNNRIAKSSRNSSSPNFIGPPDPSKKTRDTIGNNVWGNPVVNGVEGDSPFNNKTVPFTPDFSGDAPPNINLISNKTKKQSSEVSPSNKKAAPGISVPFKYDFSQDVPKQNLISTGAGINNGGVFGPPSSLADPEKQAGFVGPPSSLANDPRAEVWNSLLLPKKSPETTGASIVNKQTPMGTPNTSGTAIRSPFVAKPQINTPATNPGFMAPSQNVPNSSKYELGVSTNTELDKQTGTNGRNIGDMRKENEQYAQAAKDRGEPVLVGSPEWVAWNRAKNQKRLDDAGINKTVDQVVSPQPETASDVVGGAAAAGADYRNNPTAPEGYNNKRGMTRADFNAKRDAAEEAAYPGSTKGRPARGGGSNVGLSSSLYGAPNSEPISTTPVPSKPGTKLTPEQMSTTSNVIDDIAKVAWWRRTSAQRDVMKTSEDTKATAQRKADVDRVQAQRTATAARESDEEKAMDRYRNRQNVQEQTRDPNDPLYGLNIKQGPKRDLDADLKTLAVKAGQFGIDTAKGALKLGTLVAIPPEELLATATGRMAGLGYSKQGAKNRFDYYRTKIDQAPGALTGIIGDAGSLLKNLAPGLSNTLGKSAGKALDAITNSKLAKMGSAVAGSNTGKAIFGAAKTYGRATADEAARLMTGALYDPRSVSLPLGSEYTDPKETEPKEEEEKKTKTP